MNYVGHLSFGMQAYKYLAKYIKNKSEFLTGCVAPDISFPDSISKNTVHFRDKCKNFFLAPDVNRFLEKYKNRLNEDFIIGYFCHIYADYVFINDYFPQILNTLDENYKNDFKNVSYIKIIRNNKIIPITFYTSAEGLYDDYTKVNNDLINKYGISANIEYSLKNPNMNEIDKDKLKNIHDEIERYISGKDSIPITDSDTVILEISSYIKFIDEFSKKFAEKYIKLIK